MTKTRAPSSRHGRSQRGFTLVELMVTLAVAAILATLAVPAMQNFIAARTVQAQADELASALRLARSEALKRGVEVSVCAAKATDASACAGSSAWINGWVVFADRDHDGTVDKDDDTVIRVQSKAGGGLKEISATASVVVFRRNGLLLSGDTPLVLKPNFASTSSGYSAAVRSVCVNMQGRVAITQGSVDQC